MVLAVTSFRGRISIDHDAVNARRVLKIVNDMVHLLPVAVIIGADIDAVDLVPDGETLNNS